MASITVAIVGKPNVGKSSLFNRIARQRISITDDQPGVTRDRLYARTQWQGRNITIIDTGGINTESEVFQEEIQIQASVAIAEADVIIFVLDGTESPTEDEQFIAQILRQSQKRVVVALNKLENPDRLDYSNYSIGFSEYYLISAIHGIGIGDLLDAIMQDAQDDTTPQDSAHARLAIIGRPNVGKSSLFNTLVGTQRSIVSEIAGTTRDSVEGTFYINDQLIEVVDTAGILKRSRLAARVEQYALIRALASLDSADMAIILLAAHEPITHFHLRVAGYAHELQKPTILVINKDDLSTSRAQSQEYLKTVRERFNFLSWAPCLRISALHARGIKELQESILEVWANICRMIPQHALNTFIIEMQALYPAPSLKGQRLYIRSIKQIQGRIPTFQLNVNNRHYAHFSYLRSIENRMREQFDLTGTAIKLILQDTRRE